MTSLGSRQPRANTRALIAGALLWSLLVWPILLPLSLIVITGNTGFLVMLFVFSFAGVAGAVRVYPYLRDLTLPTAAVEGGVIEKQEFRQYLIARGHRLLIDASRGSSAAEAVGAAQHSASDAGLPEFITMAGPSPASLGTTFVVGGPSIAARRTGALNEVRDEMAGSSFSVPPAVFNAVSVGDQVRIWFHPSTRTTASVERFDSRVNRYLPVRPHP